MTNFYKIIYDILIVIFILFIVDIAFFYSIVLQEQKVYQSQQKYLKSGSNNNLYMPPYFIKLIKFKGRYKQIIQNNLRPIQNINSSEKPVLIFGCSYAYGYIFDNSETISYIMSKNSVRPIINRAISGWGIQHMLYQLKEDKEFVSSIKTPPKYIFYILMDQGGHFQRLYHTSFPSVLSPDYYFTYKLKQNELVERKPFLNFYYSFAVPRHIYNKLVMKYVQKNLYDKADSKFYNFIIRHFIEINGQIKKLWGTKTTENSPQLIILTFEGNKEEYWKLQLEKNGIKVINIAELIGKNNLHNPEYEFFEPEICGHPNGKLWKEVITKLKELYPDL